MLEPSRGALIFVIIACVKCSANGRSIDNEVPFKIIFLGRSIDFYLNEEFSARKIAIEFCERESYQDAAERNLTSVSSVIDFKNHIVAVRDLIENRVASLLGFDRIEAGFQGKDPIAFSFIQSICNDFPKNHELPYSRLLPRSSPLRIIDGIFRITKLETVLP